MGIVVLWVGAGEARVDYGNRIGESLGAPLALRTQGPGVLVNAVDPALRRWYVDQELYQEYRWRQWESTSYARDAYRRYVSTDLEGSSFYDIYGNFVTRGFLIFNNSQERPGQFGNTLFKSDRFEQWFSNVVISRDQKGQYAYALTVSSQLNTTPKSFASTWSSDPTVNHQNTPVFISYRLIQRLVTSNPSGPYLYRVSKVWRDTNGQLDDVVRAILLDPEARNLSTSEHNPEYGRKKEPIVAWIQALRAVGGRSRITFDGSVIPGDPVLLPLQNHIGTLAPTSDADLRNFDYPALSLANFEGMVKYDPAGRMIPTAPGTFARLPATSYRLQNLDNGNTTALGQTPLKAPSVFNWFLPGYKPGGLIGSYGKVAPEFQIVTESSALQNINVYWQSHYNGNGWSAGNVGGNNANSALAGYATQRQYNNGSTTYTDDNIIPDYYAWINRYRDYQIDPGNPMDDELETDLQLIDDLDDLLLAGRLKLLYPVNPDDDGTPVQQGSLTHYPGRNPRETLLYYLCDTWSTNDDWQIWSKVRNALYLMATSPEYLIQK